MADYRLLKSQKNRLFQLVATDLWDFKNFEWKETISGKDKISLLNYRESEYFFKFDHRTTVWLIRYSPGNGIREQIFQTNHWDDVKGYFINWLKFLREELREELEPDAWELAHQNKLTEASETQEDKNAKFSEDEQKLVSKALNEIKEFITAKNKLTNEQLLSLNEKFLMLQLESKRMIKEPWLHTLIGVLFGFATNAAFTPERAHQLFDFAYTCLRPVLEAPLLLK